MHPGPLLFQSVADALAYRLAAAVLLALDLIVAAGDEAAAAQADGVRSRQSRRSSRGPRECEGCGAIARRMRVCARCRAAPYCCKACQKAHWELRHRAECRECQRHKQR